MIECSFFLSVVGLVISVLISFSKWMYYHFSLGIGGPKKWHISTFSIRKTEILILTLARKYIGDVRTVNVNNFYFFPYKSVLDQIST